MTANINEIFNYSNTLTILYVEDDIAIREQMTEALQDFFQKVIVAENGRQGLEKFSSYKEEFHTYPDIVMTDIRMPHMNGIEMTKQILSLHPEQIVIINSAHNESELLFELINMNISHFLLKPLQAQQLYQTLHKASKRHYYEKMELGYKKELEKLANEDPLTCIANRRRFFQKANSSFPNVKAENLPLYLFSVDIDKFKEINDTYGHDVGDEVIKTFVDIVKNGIRENDCFSRFGGDEFVIMMMNISKEKAFNIVKSIQHNISKTHLLLGASVNFSVSIGTAEVEDFDKNIDGLLKRADVSLYKEKRSKRQYSRS